MAGGIACTRPHQVDHASSTSGCPSLPQCRGRLAEQYQLDGAPIGKGGYAVVWRALRKLDGCVVAVKSVECGQLAPKKRERCLKEAHLLQQLSHPHIIQCHDAFLDGVEGEQLIIVMEWAPGGDLKRQLRRLYASGRVLEEAAVWGYFLQVADGLRTMHAQSIMHRDIKPANVLVTAEGLLKLGDLGLGRQLGPQTVELVSKVGTPYYVSPEVVRGLKYNYKSDMWSLGCLLYELATGRSPFEAGNASLYEVFQRINEGRYEPLPERHSVALRALVTGLLSQDPAARPDAGEAWSAAVSALRMLQNSMDPAMLPLAHGVPQRARLASPMRSALGPSGCPTSCWWDGSLLSRLLALASVVHAQADEHTTGQHRRASTGSGTGGATPKAVAAALPPWPALHCAHGLFFAAPLHQQRPGRRRAGTSAEEEGADAGDEASGEQLRRCQLGVALTLSAWLLHLINGDDLARPVQALLKPTRQHVQHQQQQQQQRGEASLKGAQTCAERYGQLLIPELLRGSVDLDAAGEVLLRSVLSAGMPPSSPAITGADLAAGWGPAVCQTLHWLLHAAWSAQQAGLRAPALGAHAWRANEEEVEELEDGALQHECGSPEAASLSGCRCDPMVSTVALAAAAAPSCCAAYSPLPDGAALGVEQEGGAAAPFGLCPLQPPILPRLDVADAWRAEAERLWPQLRAANRDAIGAGMPGWRELLRQLRSHAEQLTSGAPPSLTALAAVAARVEADLASVGRLEERLNQESAGSLAACQAKAMEVCLAQERCAVAQASVAASHSEAGLLASALEKTNAAIQQQVQRLDGGAALAARRSAALALRAEIRAMDVRLGLLRHQLASCMWRSTCSDGT